MSKPNSVADFWAKVAVSATDECWEWTRGTDNFGYGLFRWGGRKQLRTHRLAYILTYGDTKTLCVLHRCDNPPCCNPAHLFLGTRADNVADRHTKGRDSQTFGAANHRAKLTDMDVRAICSIHAQGGITFAGLAAQYGVSSSTISRVVRRLRWTHVCNAGPGWKPGMPLVGRNGETLAL